MARQVGMFDVEERLADLSKKGDDLERLAAVVDFELVHCRTTTCWSGSRFPRLARLMGTPSTTCSPT